MRAILRLLIKHLAARNSEIHRRAGKGRRPPARHTLIQLTVCRCRLNQGILRMGAVVQNRQGSGSRMATDQAAAAASALNAAVLMKCVRIRIVGIDGITWKNGVGASG